jgi:hypothetical protein
MAHVSESYKATERPIADADVSGTEDEDVLGRLVLDRARLERQAIRRAHEGSLDVLLVFARILRCYGRGKAAIPAEVLDGTAEAIESFVERQIH